MKKLLILISLLACSCATQRNAEKFYRKNPDKLAEICADKFPPKEEYRLGTPELKTDTVYTPGDSIPCPGAKVNPLTGGLELVKVPCPPGKTITNTIYRTDTMLLENSAKVAALTAKLAGEHDQVVALSTEKEELQKKVSDIRIAAIFLLLAAIGLSYLVIRK